MTIKLESGNGEPSTFKMRPFGELSNLNKINVGADLVRGDLIQINQMMKEIMITNDPDLIIDHS